MKYLSKYIIYLIIDLIYLIRYRRLKLGFAVRIKWGSNFEGFNKISEYSYFSGNIGYASYIGSNSIVCGKIGRFCSIGPNVIFLTSTHPTRKYISTHPAFYSMKKQCGFTYVKEQIFNEIPKYPNSIHSIIVGNDVYIGYGVTIIGPVKIGDGAIIAANSTVTHDVDDYTVVGGTPARLIRKRFPDSDIKYLKELRWWDKGIDWIARYAKFFNSIENLQNVIDNGD